MMKRIIVCLIISLLCRAVDAQEEKFTAKPVSKFVSGFHTATGGYGPSFNSAYSNYKTKYFVLKKDSTGTNVSSKIYVTPEGRFYLSTENKEASDESHRIYADETIKINYEDQRFQKTFEGIAVENAWLFKVIEGKINLYSCYPPPDEVTNDCLSGFQFGGGEIQPLDAEALKQVVQNNPKALEAIEKKNYLKAVKAFNKE